MAKLSIECKKLMVKEIGDKLNSVETLIVTSYKGLSSQDLNNLRKELREVSGDYLVVKDSMAKKAMSEGSNKSVVDLIKGEVGIAIDSKEDPTQISKVLTKFSKESEALKIRGGIMNGKLLSIQDIKALATLPSREALLGILANVLNAPIQSLAGALNAIICKVLYALKAVKDKKEKEPKAEESKSEAKPEAKSEEKTENKEETKEPQAEKKEEPASENKQETKPEEKKEDQNG